MREHALFNLSSGPVQATARTLRALSQQILYHHDPEFIEIFDETTEKLKRFFKTKGDVIIMQGEALLGLEAAAFCTIEPGDKCLNLVSGIYGKLYAWYIEAFGGKLVEVQTDYNKVIDPADVEKAFICVPSRKSTGPSPLWTRYLRSAARRWRWTIGESTSAVSDPRSVWLPLPAFHRLPSVRKPGKRCAPKPIRSGTHT
jgi:hypothetical protein